MVELQLPMVRRESSRLVGNVIDIDRFGNLITNVRERDLGRAGVLAVCIASERIAGLSRSYDPGASLVAIFNSDGWLEIAAPGGSAAWITGVGLEAPVEIELRSNRSTE
jgi:S-adenosyl-L-methionine hydrolase (adenosine-forming)